MAMTGQCLCGAVTYTIAEEPRFTALCHCVNCQRAEGGAFSVNLITKRDNVEITGELTTFEDRGESGDAVYVYRRFCGTCGSPIISEMVEPEGRVAIKAGTLDDTSGLEPGGAFWADHKQPWVDLGDIPEQPTQP